jgi:hypothetical protein
MSKLLEEIEARLTTAMTRVASGDDLPPGQRFRLEGLMEAAVLTDAASESRLREMVERVHSGCFGLALVQRLWDGWEETHPFPSLPLYTERAPVSPSTSD